MRYKEHYGTTGTDPATGNTSDHWLASHFHLSPDHMPGLPSWLIGDPHEAVDLGRVKTGPDATYYDSPAWTFPHMQDLVESRFRYAFKDAGTGTGAGSAYSRMIQTPLPGDGFDYPAWHIINNAVSVTTGLKLDLFNVGSSNYLYYRLKDNAITREVKVEKDPFDRTFSLWSLLVDILEVKTLQRSIVHSLKTFAGNNTRLSFKAVSQSHLAIQYGLLPTLTDIREFMDLWTKYAVHDSDQDRFGAVYTSHNDRVEIQPARVTPTETYRFFGIGGSTCDLLVSRSYGPLVLSETTKYYFVAPVLADTLATLRLLIDRLGLLDPAAAWDVIPFSFVVDWFYDVSAYLHSVKPRLVPVDMLICDWAESLSQESVITVDIQGNVTTYSPYDYDDVIPFTTDNMLVMESTHRARVRQYPRPVNVQRAGIEKKKGLTLLRASLGSAIVHTNSNSKLPLQNTHGFAEGIRSITSRAKLFAKLTQQTMKISKGNSPRYRNRPVA